VSTIRKAKSSDLAEMQRLLAEASLRGSIYPPITSSELGEDYALVLDAPDGASLAAVCVLSIRGERGHLRTLVIDRRFEHLDLESRLLGVAHAVSVALGADHFDISSMRTAA
jgi:N-acetylglutamate synthase-like GNAT family acetyltransferase